MHRTAVGLLVLLLAWPALAREDKPKDDKKPAGPAEQYQALLKEYADAEQAFSKAYQEAKTDEERQKVIKEKYPDAGKLAPRFLDLAEKNPKDPAALDALVWVLSNDSTSGKDSPRARAEAILLRDHVQSDKLASLCRSLNNDDDEPLLRALLDKNPHPEVQGEACLALAQLLGRRAPCSTAMLGNECNPSARMPARTTRD